MRALLLIPAALSLLAGCDASEPGAAWHAPGATASFDYQAGDVPLRSLTGDPVPSQRRAVAMRFGELSFCPGAVCVGWRAPVGSDRDASLAFGVGFPLQDQTVRATGDGLAVVVPARCTGTLQGPGARVVVTRVPRVPADVLALAPCQTPPTPQLGLTSGGTETVSTPGGTFDAVVLVGDGAVEYWNWEVGLVRYDVLAAEGALRGRFVRSAAP